MMKERSPIQMNDVEMSDIDMNDAELVAWLADSGLNASVVARCPAAGCELCRNTPLVRAA